MKTVLMLFFILILPIVSYATDIGCIGKVTNVMDYPSQCNGQMAFTMSGTSGKWICSPSDKSDALILTAFTVGKDVAVYMNDQNNSIDCSTTPHYVPVRYIILKP